LYTWKQPHGQYRVPFPLKTLTGNNPSRAPSWHRKLIFIDNIQRMALFFSYIVEVRSQTNSDEPYENEKGNK